MLYLQLISNAVYFVSLMPHWIQHHLVLVPGRTLCLILILDPDPLADTSPDPYPRQDPYMAPNF